MYSLSNYETDTSHQTSASLEEDDGKVFTFLDQDDWPEQYQALGTPVSSLPRVTSLVVLRSLNNDLVRVCTITEERDSNASPKSQLEIGWGGILALCRPKDSNDTISDQISMFVDVEHTYVLPLAILREFWVGDTLLRLQWQSLVVLRDEVASRDQWTRDFYTFKEDWQQNHRPQNPWAVNMPLKSIEKGENKAFNDRLRVHNARVRDCDAHTAWGEVTDTLQWQMLEMIRAKSINETFVDNDTDSDDDREVMQQVKKYLTAPEYLEYIHGVRKRERKTALEEASRRIKGGVYHPRGRRDKYPPSIFDDESDDTSSKSSQPEADDEPSRRQALLTEENLLYVEGSSTYKRKAKSMLSHSAPSVLTEIMANGEENVTRLMRGLKVDVHERRTGEGEDRRKKAFSNAVI